MKAITWLACLQRQAGEVLGGRHGGGRAALAARRVVHATERRDAAV